MPYKNPEDMRKYQKDWAKRKREGKVTRNTKPSTPEQRKESKMKANEKWRKKQKQKLREMFPKRCIICNGTINLCLHRIDFETHKRKFSVYLKEPEMFVRLCYACHKGVHFAHEKMNMSWEQIRELVSV